MTERCAHSRLEQRRRFRSEWRDPTKRTDLLNNRLDPKDLVARTIDQLRCVDCGLVSEDGGHVWEADISAYQFELKDSDTGFIAGLLITGENGGRREQVFVSNAELRRASDPSDVLEDAQRLIASRICGNQYARPPLPKMTCGKCGRFLSFRMPGDSDLVTINCFECSAQR